MVKIGTKVVVNYGAGIPEEYGVVTALKNDGVQDYAVIETVRGLTLTANNIKSKGETSVNGSSIGVFTV